MVKSQKLSAFPSLALSYGGQELLALNAPNFGVKLWSAKRLFLLALQSSTLSYGWPKAISLNALKFGVKLWSTEFFSFNIPKLGTELWRANSF